MTDPDLKSRALFNPNYASVRCIQPMPGMIHLHRESNHIKSNDSNYVNVVNSEKPKRFVIVEDSNHRNNEKFTNENSHENHEYYEPENSGPNARLINSCSIHKSNDDFHKKVELNTNHNAIPKDRPRTPVDSKDKKDKENLENLLPKKEKRGMFDYMHFEGAEESHDHGNEKEPIRSLTWRAKLRNFLHSRPVHIAVIVLVLVDTILVITEILLDLHLVEVAEESPAPEIVHYCSISILSIFMIEIMAKLLADWHHFIKHKIEVLDAIVVVIAFGFDIAILFIDENEALIAVELLLLFRLWRIVRIVNGIILSVKTECDNRVHALKEKLNEKEEELKKSQESTEKKEKEIERLKEILNQNGIHVEDEPQEGATEPENGAVLRLDDSDNIISIDT